MTTKDFQGVFTAIMTPFLEDESIDWNAFDHLINRQIEAGIDGLVICGTTGESPTLSVQEKLSLIRRGKALVSGTKVKIIAGSGGQSTNQTVELSRLAMDAGADSLLIVTPPYNKPNKQGLIRHFEKISQNVSLPICLYHVPGRTAHWLSADEIAEICKIPHVHLVKEASGNIGFMSEAIQACSKDVTFLSGDDPTFLASLSIGGQGSISVISNIYPKAFKRLQESFFTQDVQLAQKIHDALMPLLKGLFWETNPSPLKFCMSQKKLCKNILRLPLAPVAEITEQKLISCLRKVDDSLATLNIEHL